MEEPEERKVHEFLHDELKGKDWVEKARHAPFRGFYHIAFLVEGRYEDGESFGKDVLDLQPLQNSDGSENMNAVWRRYGGSRPKESTWNMTPKTPIRGDSSQGRGTMCRLISGLPSWNIWKEEGYEQTTEREGYSAS